MNRISRRNFVLGSAALAGVAASRSQFAAADAAPLPGPTPPVCVFSKYLQYMSYETLGKTVRELGLDGVDLTVRAGGHVEPSRLENDLPRAVDAIREAGSEVHMITSALNNGQDPDARPILSMARQLGIKYVRIGGQMYDKTKNPADELPLFIDQVRSLAALAGEYEIALGYHNHSGYGYVGGPVWDLYRMIQEINSPWLGSNFDPAHATVEGGYGVWHTNARLMAPHVKMMAVKDFIWLKNKPEWVALGRGVVQTATVFEIMRAAGFNGPVSLQFEYKTRGNEALLADIRDAAVTCRAELAKAGYQA